MMELDKLKEAITSFYSIDVAGGIIMANMRHVESLREAVGFLSLAVESINHSQSEEFISMDIISAYTALGTILGEEIGEDIIDKIFKDFCLGK